MSGRTSSSQAKVTRCMCASAARPSRRPSARPSRIRTTFEYICDVYITFFGVGLPGMSSSLWNGIQMISGVSCKGFRLHERRIALSTETGSERLGQPFGSFACSRVWLALFRSHTQGDSHASEDRASIRYRSTASHRDPVFPYVIENKNLWQPDL